MNVVRTIFHSAHKAPILPLTRNYAFKSDLKIKWVRPEKIPCYKPEKSGDLEPIASIDKSQYVLEFQNSKELASADDVVKKLFSLEFAPRRKSTHVYIKNMINQVKRHPLDVGSMEVKIARMTGAIRAYQESMEEHPRNVRMKVILKELIDKRKKYFKYLRRWDYKRFEWLLEALNVVYKPPPNRFHWITRKESLRKLTDKYCDNIRSERLDAYRQMLADQQPAFLEEKIRSLQFIREEQIACKAEVTVTEEEIEVVRKQLNELKENKKQAEEKQVD